MCGIAGYIGRENIPEIKINKCLSVMNHRGPDARGVYRKQDKYGNHVLLLHTRLSIIDLHERANQPIQAEQLAFVYNGELYNHIEIRDQLIAKGYLFETTSDTEVFFKTLLEYGWDGLDRCEGMWAFAAYNENDGTLTLSRDRFGEKPLYYYQNETGIYFGSEIKFIFELIGKKLPVNYNQLFRYMVNGFKSLYKHNETFFCGLKEVAPSQLLQFDSVGTIKERTYWDLRKESQCSMSYDDAVKNVRKHLIHSVQLRLRSDVPLAFCMSGGVDSNSLISIAKNVFNYDVHGFTIMNTDKRYSEASMVEEVVGGLGIKHSPVFLSNSNFIDNLRLLISAHDSPISTISYYVHWLLMESIKKSGYKISISGTGADELFTGYYDHHMFYLREVFHDKTLYADSLANWKAYVRDEVRNPFIRDPNRFIGDPSFRGHIYLNSSVFSEYLFKGWQEPFAEETYDDSVLRNRMLNELFHEIVPVILHEDDLNAMFYSIENRSPFLDRSLFEFSRKVPSEYLMRDGYTKSVLREAMRGIVPDSVLNCRKKVGFNAPILSLLDTSDNRVKEFLLNDSPIYEYVYREKIRKLLEEKSMPNSRSKFLFYFVCSKLFLEEYS